MDTNTDENGIEIACDSARCCISPSRGGLITSWSVRRSNTHEEPQELVWMPTNPVTAGWPDGGIPLMFPFAGRVWDQGEVGFYKTKDGRFPMDMHGFLYEQKLSHEVLDKGKVKLKGAATAWTRARYPWDWELELVVEMPSATSLRLSSVVRHAGVSPNPMPISMGLHPFWRSSVSGTDMFQPAAKLFRRVEEGRAGKEDVISPSDPIPMTDQRLRSGIFSKLTQNNLEFDLPNQARLKTEWSKSSAIQHVVVWSNPHAGYFCPEPWMGLPDAVHSSVECMWLKPGETHACEFTFTLQDLR